MENHEAILIVSTAILTSVITVWINGKLEIEKFKLRVREKAVDKKLEVIFEIHRNMWTLYFEHWELRHLNPDSMDDAVKLHNKRIDFAHNTKRNELYLDEAISKLLDKYVLALGRAARSLSFRQPSDLSDEKFEKNISEATNALDLILREWKKNYGFGGRPLDEKSGYDVEKELEKLYKETEKK